MSTTTPIPLRSGTVTCEVTDGVAQVRLNRPEKLNGVTLGMLADLVVTGRRLRDDRTLRAVVIAGEGRSFTAGLDFGTVMRDPTSVATAFVPRPWRGTNTFQEACWVWRRLPVPVIAAVHGHCFGAGVQIALAADLRYTTPDATWSVLESKWGLIPDMSGVRTLAEQVGMDTAKRLAMTGTMLSGVEAHELGLATGVSADPHQAAADVVAEIAHRSPDAVAAVKRVFQDTWTASPRRTFARERAEQARLLVAANTRAAREAAYRKVTPVFGPRARR